MNIIVCVKQIVDLQQVRMDRETKEPILEGLPMLLSDFDKNALEEATRIKEKVEAKVTALSVSSRSLKETITEALARGADEAVTLVDVALRTIDSVGKAQVIAKAIEKIGSYDLILMGEGSADNNSGQTGPRVAHILGLPVINYARRVEVEGDKVRVVKTLEDCFETVQAVLPAVVMVSDSTNEPRIPSITDVLDASSKPVGNWSLSDIDISPEELDHWSSIEVLTTKYQEQDRKQILLEADLSDSVPELVQSLIREGVLEK